VKRSGHLAGLGTDSRRSGPVAGGSAVRVDRHRFGVVVREGVVDERGDLYTIHLRRTLRRLAKKRSAQNPVRTARLSGTGNRAVPFTAPCRRSAP